MKFPTFRFSLRTILVLVLACGVFFGWLSSYATSFDDSEFVDTVLKLEGKPVGEAMVLLDTNRRRVYWDTHVSSIKVLEIRARDGRSLRLKVNSVCPNPTWSVASLAHKASAKDWATFRTTPIESISVSQNKPLSQRIIAPVFWKRPKGRYSWE